ncbi:amino acid permease [Acetobacter orientalis]|uniref:Amino acid permease n=1 Tax=Acetobacter orientalis TaxID=146474 RepID=A0A2Z5ZGP4_9PROT|nr:amino acid permease [Acetobacter orientalis]BBC79874.1 amino acid permease [Acetobacter orientalis]GAN64948.1 amino acid permease [Acetobacter orientalis]GBR15795.1 L-asparagine permease [Acetobacter orientalis NRIC 0481]GEL61731.1 L-asparagine permease [Acetobacter orientalis]
MPQSAPLPTSAQPKPASNLTSEGYHRGLGKRQMQMISIGGAIGTGLFLGAGSRLQQIGPSLALVYLVCGIFAFLMLRAMGELVMHRPTSGSFVSYAQEFLGPKASYIAGSMAFLNWAMAGIGDITAVALYMRFWGSFDSVPQWVFALVALVLITVMNMIGVRWFGEMEFWFSLVKVGALVTFLVVGTIVLGLQLPLAGHTPGLHLITQNGGIFPHGVLPALVLVQGVVFAYAAIELVGTAAGECEDVENVLPKAINTVMWRIALFYVGTITLLVLLLPWNSYHAGVSPFVTFFANLGIPGVDSIMNIVVLTAALSSLNSGLYSTGRILRALALDGSAPRYLTHMNKNAIPSAAILTTVSIYLVGVVLNYLLPAQIFEIVLNVSSIGILGTWAFIVLCQIKLRQAINNGTVRATSFPMPGAPFTSWLTLAFYACVLVMMAFDYPNGTWSFCAIPVIALLLVIGWKTFRHVPNHEAVPQTVPSIQLTEDLLEHTEHTRKRPNKD